MTPRQELFVAEYLVDLNATQAAIRAGYSAKTASRIGPELLGKTCVAEAIQTALEQRKRSTGITAEYVVEGLREVAERCLQRAPVLSRKGEQIQDENGCDVWAFDSNGANRALELLGKHVGVFPTNGRLELSLGGDASREGDREGRTIARRLILEEVRETRDDDED